MLSGFYRTKVRKAEHYPYLNHIPPLLPRAKERFPSSPTIIICAHSSCSPRHADFGLLRDACPSPTQPFLHCSFHHPTSGSSQASSNNDLPPFLPFLSHPHRVRGCSRQAPKPPSLLLQDQDNLPTSLYIRYQTLHGPSYDISTKTHLTKPTTKSTVATTAGLLTPQTQLAQISHFGVIPGTSSTSSRTRRIPLEPDSASQLTNDQNHILSDDGNANLARGSIIRSTRGTTTKRLSLASVVR